MFCALSGEPPQEPVICKKSGQIFEKRLIEKYISDYGKDPISGEDITEDDLLEIKASPKTVKPRPATLTSIPSLLAVFQNEWDSLMLETFTLKQQYQQVRQELSHALYQHDAACRVIARLMKERDAAREALTNVQAHINVQPPPESTVTETPMEVEEEMKGINETVIEKLNETSKTLSQGRKKRKAPPNLTSVDTVKTFTQITVIGSLHTTSSPGITCLDLDQTGELVITGGNDKKALIYNRKDAKEVCSLKGHTKKITDVLWLGKPEENNNGDIAFTSSADKTIKIWKPNENNKKGYKVASNITSHSSEVTGIALHATKQYLVSVSNDSTWAFHDVTTSQTLSKIESKEVKTGYSTVEFHPDGLILGTGTNDSVVRIWDVKSQQNVASFDNHAGRITSIAFSENGYYLATASEEHLVKLWDLRKLSNFQTLVVDAESKVNKVVWDFSGQYLAVGGTDNMAEITDMKFGELAKYLLVGGLDRSLRIYGYHPQ
ncbi:2448_t:CDS:2 [Diversispora eburnea]|uniref:Pre-mRNA-processing factor 19 n=1 Tax=Diversispora eburnea TaxID=1213867 RepID=A0A9N9A322_9GLOM|nr:2448_t:CDS:2 [Diversispora eburnea]